MQQNVYSYINYHQAGCPEHLVIPEGYTSVNSEMLVDYFDSYDPTNRPTENLKSLTLPASMKYIGKNAFANCSNLESIIFTDLNSRMRIGEGAFAYCNKLRNQEIPLQAKLEKNAIPEKAVRPLKEFTKEDYEKLSDKQNVIIPEGYEKIADGTFANSSLSSVKLPSTMKAIGDEAFRHCYLEAIDFPDSVMVLGKNVFRDCPRLASVRLPEKIEVIPEGFAYNCRSLKEVNIPDGTVELGKEAFMESGITAIHFPDSMRVLHERSLSCCENLKEVTGPASMAVEYGVTLQSLNIEKIDLRGDIQNGNAYQEFFRNPTPNMILLISDEMAGKLPVSTLQKLFDAYKEAKDFSEFETIEKKLAKTPSLKLSDAVKEVAIKVAEDKERIAKEKQKDIGKGKDTDPNR